jgi:SAM-dependent methyltransferase
MAATNPVEDFIRHTLTSLGDNTFVRLVLSGGTEAEGAPKRVLARLIRLRGEPHLSLTLRHATNDVTKNLELPEVAKWLGYQLKGNFRSALLGTTVREWQLNFPPDKEPWLISHQPHAKKTPSRDHDEAKQTWLDASARDWLFGLGVCDDRGRTLPSMADKHRQIHQYLEILAHLAKDCGWLVNPPHKPRSSGRESAPYESPGDSEPTDVSCHDSSRTLTIADMGCGKGYLTFGAWHLLCRRWRIPARVIGVETRPELVKNINYLARKIDAPGLEFIAGDIAATELPSVDALIALHACNTATDDAIRRGVDQQAKLIVVAPCCHKEVRPQLGKPVPFTPVLEHGIMAERMAEWVTDGLRALFLEWAGYRTKIIEFVSSEHTPKNLMLAAIREREPFTNEATREKIVELKQFFGIEHHALDSLLEKSSTTDGHG